MTSRTTRHTLREVVFLVLLLALYVSQVFLVVPGANLDAANYGHYDTINFLGLSYSSWLSLILICWCTISVLMNLGKLRFTRPSLLCLLAIAGFTVIGALNSSVSGIADLGVKMLMPFTAYFYIRYVLIELESREIDRLLLAINLFLIGQVLICKLITGEFSANHYYTYIMDRCPAQGTSCSCVTSCWECNPYACLRSKNLSARIGIFGCVPADNGSI